MLKLFNTASGKKEEFVPLKKGKAGMYTCGMTVYDYAHIGHGRKYVGDDMLRRTLEWSGYKVTHVQNVTDVGHLSSDEDEGEDKMEKGALKHGKDVWEVAQYFTDDFYTSMDALNIERPTIICKATDHIPEQITLVQKLIKKGFAYDTPEAVYFDISAFPDYGILFGQKLEDKKTAVRAEVNTGEYKKNPRDFVLWFKRVGHFANHTMHWESPWGDGFPGWHLECSAMSMKYLGETFDIHTGGIDHISVHHANEIAQSEAVTGKSLAHYWVHYAFLTVDGTKMSKSLGNYITIDDVIKKGYDPIVLRYLYLSAHYRQQLNFTWEALEGAKAGYENLKKLVGNVKMNAELPLTKKTPATIQKIVNEAKQQFADALEDDINTSRAVATIFELFKKISQQPLIPADYALLYETLLKMDTVLGLKFADISASSTDVLIPSGVEALVDARERARKEKNWKESDRLRDEIAKYGFAVEDTAIGSTVRPL